MKTLRILLLAWWFLSYSLGSYNRGTATVVGPFRDDVECYHARTWAIQASLGNAVTSWCWWDGKP